MMHYTASQKYAQMRQIYVTYFRCLSIFQKMDVFVKILANFDQFLTKMIEFSKILKKIKNLVHKLLDDIILHNLAKF